jgi:hypothetical protein
MFIFLIRFSGPIVKALPMTDHIIPRLLERRGVWMTAAQIFAASPDYPDGQYVLADLKTLAENGLVVARDGTAPSATEYGLPAWKRAPTPIPSARELLHQIHRLTHQATDRQFNPASFRTPDRWRGLLLISRRR